MNVKIKTSVSIIDPRETPGNNVNCELDLMLLIGYKSRLSISSCYKKSIEYSLFNPYALNLFTYKTAMKKQTNKQTKNQKPKKKTKINNNYENSSAYLSTF